MKVFRKIGFTLTLCFLIPVCFIILLGVVSYNKSKEAITVNYETSSLQTMNAMNRYIALVVDTIQTNYKEYSVEGDLLAYFKGQYNNDAIMRSSIKSNYTTTFNGNVTKNVLLSNLYMISDIVTPIMTTQPVNPENLYSAYAATPQGVIAETDPQTYYLFGNQSDADSVLGTDSSAYSLRLVKRLNNAKAFMIMDISYSVLAETLATLDCGDGSLVGLITCDSTEFYAQDSNGISIVDTDFYQRALDSELSEGMEYVSLDGTEYLFLYSKLSSRSAMIVSLIPQAIISAQTDDIRQLTALITIVASIIAALLGILIANSFAHTIKAILKKLKQVSGGDLTVEVKTRRKDEFRLLCDGINSMIDHMKILLNSVKEVTGELTTVSAKVAETSDLFVNTSQDIQTSISEIETGTHRLDTDSASCLSQMDSLSEQIQTVSGNTLQIQDLTSSASQSVQVGMESVSNLNESAHSTYEITQQVIASIEVLSDKSKSIREIITVINDIAEETSLLSLNASIEAARAGEAGRGFTVVAEQIKKLANQSISASEEINTIITEIVENTENAVEAAKHSEDTVSQQEKGVEVTANSFRDINDKVTQLVNALTIIYSNIQDMEEDRKTTLASVESISAISTETAAGASNVTATTNEQLSAIEKLEQETVQMQKLAEQLNSVMGRFRI